MSDKEKFLVSVIIPVYNREKDVLSTLKNIFENKYRPIQLILVDDGSTDGSLKVLEEFKVHHESNNFNVLVLEQINQGAPVARNKGYQQAKGGFIQFLDSDDRISEDKFQIQIKKMEQLNADFGLCDFEMIDTKFDRRVYHSNRGGIKKVLRTTGSFGCGSPLLRKSLSDKIEWTVGLRRNQDVDYFLKAALMSKKIAYVEEPLYYYIRHEGERISASYSKTTPVYAERIRSLIGIFATAPRKFSLILAILFLSISKMKYRLKN